MLCIVCIIYVLWIISSFSKFKLSIQTAENDLLDLPSLKSK
jgi:hypothetical protein